MSSFVWRSWPLTAFRAAGMMLLAALGLVGAGGADTIAADIAALSKDLSAKEENKTRRDAVDAIGDLGPEGKDAAAALVAALGDTSSDIQWPVRDRWPVSAQAGTAS